MNELKFSSADVSCFPSPIDRSAEHCLGLNLFGLGYSNGPRRCSALLSGAQTASPGGSWNCRGKSSGLAMDSDGQRFSLSPRERAAVRVKVATLLHRAPALCALAFG